MLMEEADPLKPYLLNMATEPQKWTLVLAAGGNGLVLVGGLAEETKIIYQPTLWKFSTKKA